MFTDRVLWRIAFIVLCQQLIAVFKQNYQRWVIKTHFTTGELTIMRMFSIDFLSTLTLTQVLWLGGLALFTFATFPLGVWLSSFDMGASYPVMNMISGTINLATFPVAIYTMSTVLGEMELNRTTWAGISLVAASKVIIVIGCWLMYQGNNGGPP